MDLRDRKVFYRTIDGANHDKRTAAIQRDEYGFKVLRKEIVLLASALEIDSEHDETGDDAELDNQSSFEEVASHLLLAFGEVCVGAVGCTVAVEGLHNTGDCSEGCQNAAWVDWGVVRHIVQYAS